MFVMIRKTSPMIETRISLLLCVLSIIVLTRWYSKSRSATIKSSVDAMFDESRD